MIIKSIRNKRHHKYEQTHTLCIDIIKLGFYGYLLLVSDFKTRAIIRYAYNPELLRPIQIHSIYKAIEKKYCCIDHLEIVYSGDIELSGLKTSQFNEYQRNLPMMSTTRLIEEDENKVLVEIKESILNEIRTHLHNIRTVESYQQWDESKQQDPLLTPDLVLGTMNTIIKKFIESYNHRPQEALDNLSPHDKENQLTLGVFSSEKIEKRGINALSIENRGSHLTSVITKHLPSSKMSQLTHDDKSTYDDSANNTLDIQKQPPIMSKKNLETQQSSTLVTKQDSLDVLNQGKAPKLALVDVISIKDLHFILSTIQGTNLIKERRIMALILKYATALHYKELVLLTVKNVKELMEQGSTRLGFKENGANMMIFKLVINSQGRRLLHKYKETFSAMCYDKQDDQYLFTQINHKVMSYKALHREIHVTLKRGSELLQKTIKAKSLPSGPKVITKKKAG